MDLAFPKKGHYHLENAIVRTNGRMRLEADEKTRVKNAGGLLARAKRFFGHLFGPPVPPGPGRGL